MIGQNLTIGLELMNVTCNTAILSYNKEWRKMVAHQPLFSHLFILLITN
jgi:hypothetical protein